MIRLILSLVNNLDEFGGKHQYVKWAEAAGVNSTGSPDLFFSDETVKGYYKDYVKTILTRKNSYSGIKYRDEPAIFAWDLINEPRCVSNSSAPDNARFDASQYSFFGKNVMEEVDLGGMEGDDDEGEMVVLLGLVMMRTLTLILEMEKSYEFVIAYAFILASLLHFLVGIDYIMNP